MRSRSKVNFTSYHLFLLVLISLSLFSFGWLGKTFLAGKQPTKTFQQEAEIGTEIDDPEIKSLRAAADQSPKDITKWKALSEVLIDRLKKSEAPTTSLIHTAIETFAKILELDPKDPSALIAMADISFDSQVFEKAEMFYRRYLEIQPNDVNARARYGSSMTFGGKYPEALKELESILKKDPKHFQAAAYVAITYAQMGEIDVAKKKANEAILLAPNEEAKARFAEFIDAMNKEGGMPVHETASQPPPSQAPKPRPNLPPDAAALTAYIQNNPVAGPKFVESEVENGSVLVLKFANFPMQQMPPFAKDKFFNGIKSAAQSANNKTIKKVRFVDTHSGLELSSLDLN